MELYTADRCTGRRGSAKLRGDFPCGRLLSGCWKQTAGACRRRPFLRPPDSRRRVGEGWGAGGTDVSPRGYLRFGVGVQRAISAEKHPFSTVTTETSLSGAHAFE